MNEEIKIKLTTRGFVDLKILPLIEELLEQRLKEERIKTAKEMWDAVKLKRGNEKYQDTLVEKTWNLAISEINHKAQQFIESLEKEDGVK